MRKLAITSLILPLALGLAACKGETSGTEGPTGAPIAKIAPPAGKTWAETVVTTPEGGFRMGNPEAPIKLVEFGSMTCSACKNFAEMSAVELRDNFVASGRVSFEFRNYVRDPLDVTIAQLARCGAPEGFFARTDQAFANFGAMSEYAQTKGGGEAAFQAAQAAPATQRGAAYARLYGLLDFFASRGVSNDQALSCLANADEATALAQRTAEYTKTYAIEGTPTFLLNGSKMDVNTWPMVKAELERAGAR